MLVDPQSLLAALHLPANTRVEVEPLDESGHGPERVTVFPADGESKVVLVRRSPDPVHVANNVAILQRLAAESFRQAPRFIAAIGNAAVEEWVDGLSALAVVPPPGACEAAMEAFAALHSLPIRDGLRWELAAEAILPGEEIPLHRLGFAHFERDAARAPLAAVRNALLESPFGFCHGNATAAHLLLRPGAATICNFERAGFGPQFFDVAAFLLTSGFEASARRELAGAYARARSLPPASTARLIDQAGISWGLAELLSLPHRFIAAFGDDAAVEALRTAAGRVEREIRSPAGDAPEAAAVRAALWG